MSNKYLEKIASSRFVREAIRGDAWKAWPHHSYKYKNVADAAEGSLSDVKGAVKEQLRKGSFSPTTGKNTSNYATQFKRKKSLYLAQGEFNHKRRMGEKITKEDIAAKTARPMNKLP